MSNINIKVESYKLDEVKKQLINCLMSNHPGKTIEWYSNELGISSRSFYRYLKKQRKK